MTKRRTLDDVIYSLECTMGLDDFVGVCVCGDAYDEHDDGRGCSVEDCDCIHYEDDRG